MLPYLNTIVEQQANPTQNIKSGKTHLLDYAATNPTNIVQYKAIDVVLYIDSGVSYLS